MGASYRWECPCGETVEGHVDFLERIAAHRRTHPLVVLVGPVTWWWGDNWNTPEHWAYVTWRERVRTRLVVAGCLTYAPWEAIKGTWRPVAQAINEQALLLADVVVNLRPADVPSAGTDAELEYAAERCRARVVAAAPPFWREAVELYKSYGTVTSWFWDDVLDELVEEVRRWSGG